MNIKHHELEIPSGNPFVNCKLKRNEYAHILTNVIESYPDGFVMAINNKWGTGKTTFIKMWNQHLKDSEYQTIYFNGAFVLQAFQKQPIWDFIDLYQETISYQNIKMSIPVFTLCLDWLFLLNLLEFSHEGTIKCF